jgi:phage repressor protein C with HTH and peptisase S24 domain
MLKTIYQNRYEHLREIIERHGGQSAVAEKLEVSKQYINLIGSENAHKTIGNKMARKIETEFGMPIGTIDQEAGAKRENMEEHSVGVPMLNAVASMGAGAAVQWEEETVQNIRFSKRWLRHNTEASSFQALAIVTAKGDSMSPTFEDGAILLVDTAITQMKVDAVYVLLREDELFVKRIQRNLEGSFNVISDNPSYKTQTIKDPSASGLLVLGRVLLALCMKKM